MAGKSTFETIGKTICEEYLGFAPTTNATKPPHVANGLFRLCTGETCNTSDVHEWVVSENRSKSISSEEIKNKYQFILENGFNEKTDNIKEFRFLLDEIFNQDNTVYPNYEYSVMNISSHWLIKKKLNSEVNIGDFLFEVLSKKINGNRSPIIDLIREILEIDNDDLTKLIKPIIAFPSDQEKRILSDIEYPLDEDIKWDICKQTIREGFDNLANTLSITGQTKNNLLFLERVVNYSLFATFFYLVHANESLNIKVKAPIVLDASGDIESIKKASEQSYTTAKRSVEDYFVEAIKQIVSNDISSNDDRLCRNWIEEIVGTSTDKELDEINAVKSYYKSFLAENTNDPVYALSRALQIAVYTFVYKNNSPSDFCRVLGVRSGLIGPKGNRAKNKRYLMNSFTLETITLSVLSKDDLETGIEMRDLAIKLFDKYQFIIGADVDSEYKYLTECNIAQSTPGDLRGDLSINAQAFANTLISLGLGKQYADGVTLIGWRL